MPPLMALAQACAPRKSVFEQRGSDTVYNIDDLPQIDGAAFFDENYITEGMRVLLTEAFKRLEGGSSSASGAFLLPNVCVVLTDLSGAAYSSGSAAMSEALTNLEREVHRNVVRIDPVRLTSNEVYRILQTRLFERLPSDDAVDAVAEGYRQAVERARLMDITAASPEQVQADIRAAYPFHPAIRDLYARFKENAGFQQTRALIRLTRLIVADLWETGAASEQYLIGAQDIDLHQQDILSEIRQINPSLESAIAHDIASEGRSAVAEQIDRGESTDAEDVAHLVFLSSLSQAVNPTLGLDRSEIVRYLAATDATERYVYAMAP